MSYSVNGKTYHSYKSYQKAKRKYDLQQAKQQAKNLQNRVGDLSRQIQNRERELEQARGDLQRQTQINRQIQADVNTLRNTQNQLAQTQRSMEQRMNREFQEIHGHLQKHGEDIAAIEREHREHVAQVNREFTAVRQEMERGFAEVEERRRQTEERLNQEIKKVDDKVEADRRERLEKQRSELDRANEQINMVNEILARNDQEVDALNLRENVQTIRMKLDEAQRLHSQKDSASALAIGHDAYSMARALERHVQDRRAELTASKENVTNRVDYLRQMMADKDVEKCFPHEKTRAESILERLSNRAKGGYNRYRSLDIEAHKDDELLKRLEEQVFIMSANTGVVKEMGAERAKKAEKLVEDLTEAYGPVSDVSATFADPQDVKSPMVVHCDFGGAKVDVHLDLDGNYIIDGYGHEDNTTCAAGAERVVEKVANENVVSEKNVETRNRVQPSVQHTGQKKSTWQDVGSRLDDMERTQL